jgi:hypothetical protein
MPNDSSITQAVGSGPYTLAEYQKGSHFLLRPRQMILALARIS